ncbi:hypothetical protein ABWL39_19515 [Chitinivorax sp. PXF-14]|uniref:hypothetical protein n=1 Tax=Chitinivorax sp. PXF-14 TaxID=3230488 RepID=UPI00346757B8
MKPDGIDDCISREPQHAYTLGLAGERYYGPEDAAHRAGQQEGRRQREAEGWRESIARLTQGRLW